MESVSRRRWYGADVSARWSCVVRVVLPAPWIPEMPRKKGGEVVVVGGGELVRCAWRRGRRKEMMEGVLSRMMMADGGIADYPPS